MDGLTILLCITLSIPLIIFMLNNRHGRKKNLPPGPPALLFIAKMLMLGSPIYHFGPVLRSLHARYGPIISVCLGRTFVFVADRHLAYSALIKSGGNFDTRPPPSKLFTLFLGGSMSASPLGAYFRLVRRNLHSQALQPSRVKLFAPARQRVLDEFVGSLRRDSDAAASSSQLGMGIAIVTVRPLMARCLFDLLTCMTFGVSLGQEALDELQQMQLKISDGISRFPVLSIFQGITKRLLQKQWASHVALRERQKELMVPLIREPRGHDVPQCYADSLLELRVAEEGDRPLTDDEMVSLCSEFMIASTDTSVALLEWIMADLVNHPDVQAKLYEEVRGKPELSEEELSGMPYLKAIVLEGLRLHPTAHLFFPHGVQSDMEIGGYMVPKGADINFLAADFGLDETVWPAAREFRPERFLHDHHHGVDIKCTKGIKMAPFGAGRRMCPGYVLATLHAEYLVGSLVRDFQWLPPTQGTVVDMTEDLAMAINMKHPLRARIIPRA